MHWNRTTQLGSFDSKGGTGCRSILLFVPTPWRTWRCTLTSKLRLAARVGNQRCSSVWCSCVAGQVLRVCCTCLLLCHNRHAQALLTLSERMCRSSSCPLASILHEQVLIGNMACWLLAELRPYYFPCPKIYPQSTINLAPQWVRNYGSQLLTWKDVGSIPTVADFEGGSARGTYTL